MSVSPDPIIASAMVAGLMVFVFTILYFRVPLPGISPMQRFYLTWFSGFAVWGCLLLMGGWVFPVTAHVAWDLMGGGLMYISFVWANYWFANLGGGFRVMMLLDLAAAKRTLKLHEWMNLYGGGRGMRLFLDDRLQAILLPWRIVRQDGDVVTITPGVGRFFVFAMNVLSIVLLKEKSRA